jgi:hypothetical protein
MLTNEQLIGGVVLGFIFNVVCFLIAVAILRWAFRINDIVVSLTSIIDRLDILIDPSRREVIEDAASYVSWRSQSRIWVPIMTLGTYSAALASSLLLVLAISV